jgi:hypothetical protein
MPRLPADRCWSAVVWCGALAGVAAAQQPFVLPPPVAAAIHDKVAREPFLLLRELLDPDQEHRQAARDRWQLLEPKQQVALVRAGLRQDGEVGVGAAVAALPLCGRTSNVAATSVSMASIAGRSPNSRAAAMARRWPRSKR